MKEGLERWICFFREPEFRFSATSKESNAFGLSGHQHSHVHTQEEIHTQIYIIKNKNIFLKVYKVLDMIVRTVHFVPMEYKDIILEKLA